MNWKLEAELNYFHSRLLLVMVFITEVEGKLEHESCSLISSLTVKASTWQQSWERKPETGELKTLAPTRCVPKRLVMSGRFLSKAVSGLSSSFYIFN